METVPLLGVSVYDKQVVMYTSTVNKVINFARELLKKILEPLRKNGVIYHGKYRKWVIQKLWTNHD